MSLLDKIRDGKVSLTDAKNDHAEFKSNLNEIKKGNKKLRLREQKNALYNIEMLYKARRVTKQETLLLNFLMIILQWYPKQNLKQLKQQDLKY